MKPTRWTESLPEDPRERRAAELLRAAGPTPEPAMAVVGSRSERRASSARLWVGTAFVVVGFAGAAFARLYEGGRVEAPKVAPKPVRQLKLVPAETSTALPERSPFEVPPLIEAQQRLHEAESALEAAEPRRAIALIEGVELEASDLRRARAVLVRSWLALGEEGRASEVLSRDCPGSGALLERAESCYRPVDGLVP